MSTVELSSLCRFGVFSAADARRAGLAPNRLAALVASGAVHQLIHGWYCPDPPVDARDRHRLMAIAAYRRLDGRAMVSHHSAFVLQGLPTHRVDLSRVHLTRTIPGSSRVRPGLMLHPQVAGLPVSDRVPVATAVVQSGLVAEPLTALVAADAALRAGQATPEALAEAIGTFRHHKAIAPVRAILSEADGRISSVGETILGHRLRRLGWALEPQFEVLTDRGRRYADFCISGTRVLVEFDGALKYESRKELFEEKQREDALRRAGWVVVRFVWRELDDVELIRRRVEEAIASSTRGPIL